MGTVCMYHKSTTSTLAMGGVLSRSNHENARQTTNGSYPTAKEEERWRGAKELFIIITEKV